ncbi:MAG: hypothetical protein M0Z33_11395, partial [Actinomycetota bacterium]|nr:hypothetical protein [Actinomycetota bacterium]
MAQDEDPIGFTSPPRRPRSPEPSPAADPRLSPSPEIPSEEQLARRDELRRTVDVRPGGLRGRVEQIRQLATGGRSPLGSAEGRDHPPRPTPSRSRDSSDAARVTDALAVGFRQVTKALDWALGDRIGRDFTATAAECYEVAAPAAGYILEQIPETGPLAGIEQRAGLVGAAFALLGYGARVSFRRPGGNAEA